MAKRWKGLTTIGLMAGSEVGADFFRPWRAAKAHKDFIDRAVDFVLFPGCLLNTEALNAKLVEWALKHRKSTKKRSVGTITPDERIAFCRQYLKQIFDEVLVPFEAQGELVKYWVFPCPLFELKKDRFGVAAYIYDQLPSESKKVVGKNPYVRIGSIGELVEIEDNVAIKTLGTVMPTTSFFRAKILSTPIEREITYQQMSSFGRPIPDLYVAGSFAASIDEPNPRTVSTSRPYVSVPSLSINFTESVLQNTLGYAVLELYPERKNRAQHQFSCYPLDDAAELECAYARDQISQLASEDQKKVACAIVDKILVGTKVTLGKLENATGFTRERVIKAVKGLRRTSFKVDLEIGEIKNPHRIIPRTRKDLTGYRVGDETKRTTANMACLHIPDVAVDYEFIERDLPIVLFEEGVDTVYVCGDVTEGIKYNQDRDQKLLDRIVLHKDQKQFAGYFIGTRVVFPLFFLRYQGTRDLVASLPRVVSIPGNHDESHDKADPTLAVFREKLVSSVADFVSAYLASVGEKTSLTQHDLVALVSEKMVLLDNPSMDGSTGLLHEYSQSAEQSTGKVQKALKQFLALSPEIRTLLLANHHEFNFLLVRIGNKTIKLYHLGTLKRFYSFESQRSKISEFGIAIDREVLKGNAIVRNDTKFVPSRVDFRMQSATDYVERNRSRGIAYYEELQSFLKRGYAHAVEYGPKILAEFASKAK